MDSPPSRPSCANCATELVGPYCYACGQERSGPEALEVRHFLHDFREEALHLEFKSLRSIAALVRPGFLTASYLDGRRRAYTRPVQLYLMCGAIFFFCAPLAGFTLDGLLAQDTSGVLRSMVDARVVARRIPAEVFAERFDPRLQTVYTFALSISIASVALLLKLLYRRQRRPFGAHLVFAVHYVAFLYLAAVVVGMVNRAAGLGGGAGLITAYVVIAPYLFVALRRVYREPVRRTLMALMVLLVVSLVIDNLVNASAIFLTLQLV
jgi:hypothetical protein